MEDICRPHGGIVGRCPLCKRDGGQDAGTAAARVIAEVRADRRRLIACTACQVPARSDRRTHCGCGAWYCRAGQTCRTIHGRSCPGPV